MKVAIIGAGFTGLAAGYDLVKKGHQVEIFESQEKPGGLATGFRKKNWLWHLEKHYHHVFTSDWAIRNLAKETGHTITFSRPKTSFLTRDKSYQLDDPNSLLKFPLLSWQERLRTGVGLFFLKINPFWKPLEKITAEKFLKITMGEKSWRVLWEPLFKGKFGKHKSKIPASWFWARIKKRSAALGYPEGGFESLAETISNEIIKRGGKIRFNSNVNSIEKKKNEIIVTTSTNKFSFDKLISTLPTPVFFKIARGLPENYMRKYSNLKGLGALNLVLILNKKFFDDDTYWLSVGDESFPFVGIMEHTNFVDSKNYNKEKILYVGNYLENSHPYFSNNEKELLEEFMPYLKRINPKFGKSWIKKAYIFKALFAQPVISLNYSIKIPPLTTPIKGVFLANIQQVYPWDRGTNYAIELGEKVARLIKDD